MNNIDIKLEALSKSKFRSQFHLSTKDKDYIKDKGIDKIRDHAKDFITKRLKVQLPNDGKQTPFKGHPVFVAQHATATCCRGCIEKWYKISQEKELNDHQIDFFTDVIMTFIQKEI